MVNQPSKARRARDFGGASYGQPSVVQPWSTFLRGYQRVVYLPGTFLLVFVVARDWWLRRRGWIR